LNNPIDRIGRRGLLLAALGATLLPAAALAAPAALTPQDEADLQRLAAYLNGIHTMTARFQQVAANGGVATGRLWLERPGRMRFAYDPPSPILLLADRFYVYYVDKQLQTMQKVGLKFTPAWFLLRDPISFADLEVTRFERGPHVLRVTVTDPAHPDNGQLTMLFTEAPLALRQWTIVDQERKSTTVTIDDAQFGMALDPKLFQYQDPFANSRNDSP
jgi:outer membrane lipoprotein-sorting protein